MRNLKKYISMEECVDGHFYIMSARNGHIGIYDATEKRFTLSRHKFSDNFIDYEYHWDIGEPYGTVKPLKDLGIIPLDRCSNGAMIRKLNALEEKHKSDYEFLITNIEI